MVTLFIFGCAVGVVVGLLGPMVKNGAQQIWSQHPRKRLPAGDNIPEDRAEAVRRVLKHLQRKTIAQLEEGSAAVIVGTVKAITGISPLHSPLSGAQCLGFHVDVRGAELDHTLRFPQLRELAAMVEIEVEDETGTVRVSAESMDLAITDGPIGRWDPPFPSAIHALVPGYPRAVTVEEGLLHPGAKILVCGVAVRELGVTDYRDGASVLVLRATQTFPLVASTDPDLLMPGTRPIAPEDLRRRR